MKIDDSDMMSSSIQNVGRTSAKAGVSKSGSKASTGGAVGSGDAITLNSGSRLVSAAMTAGESARTERIQELRGIYGAGDNPVSSMELSGIILNAHLSGR